MIDKGEWGWLRGTTKHLEKFEIDLLRIRDRWQAIIEIEIENSNFNETLYRN